MVRYLPAGAQVSIYCRTPGTTVTGTYGTSNIWDNISNGGVRRRRLRQDGQRRLRRLPLRLARTEPAVRQGS
ncbi:hypothetical protein [Streptomyces massasporeus]|uniref:hypothetical protein n=1 Tax=Streptomyces massasporeus TaxID=67324 RepID=UPI003F514E89